MRMHSRTEAPRRAAASAHLGQLRSGLAIGCRFGAAIFLAAMLVVAALGLWRFDATLRAQRAEAVAHTLRVAEAMGRVLDGLELLLTFVADRVATTDDLSDIGASLAVIRETIPSIRTIIVLDEDGIVRADLRAGAPALGQSVEDRRYFRVHRDVLSSGLHVGAPVMSRVDTEPMFPISRAVRRPDGTLIAVVVASVVPGFYGFITGDGTADRGERLYFVDAPEGIVGELAEQLLGPEAVDAVLGLYREATADKGTLAGPVTQRAGGLFTVVAPIPHHDLRMVVTHAEDRMRAVAWRAKAMTGLVGGSLALALALGVALLIGREHVRQERTRLAEALAERWNQFVLSMSHDVRTPLNAVLGFSALIGTEADQSGATGAIRRAAGLIHASGLELLRVFENAMTHASAGLGSPAPRPERLDPAGLARDLVDRLRPNAEAKRVALTLTAADAVPGEVLTDPALVRTILVNLLSNAIKYTPPGGRVDVTVACDAAGATVTVADTGVGMTAAEAARLGEPFYRADGARMAFEAGAGLGMTIVKTAVQALGATMAIDTAPGEGTRVCVRIPAGGA